jgi:hypothetical protein
MGNQHECFKVHLGEGQTFDEVMGVLYDLGYQPYNRFAVRSHHKILVTDSDGDILGYNLDPITVDLPKKSLQELRQMLAKVGPTNKMFIQSRVPQGIPLQLSKHVDQLEFCSFTYMCIKQAGQSDYYIPDNLSELVMGLLGGIWALSPSTQEEAIKKNVYITVKKGWVQEGSYGNRAGWHIDGFLSDQENFIWQDSEELPTHVSEGDFRLTPDHGESLEEMCIQASRVHHFDRVLEANHLYSMNQSVVHRPSVNRGDAVLRTFIKLTFSEEEFNCVGNAWNYKLPHIKPTAQRAVTRNHTVL